MPSGSEKMWRDRAISNQGKVNNGQGKVIVAHPGAQHSHYLAVALQENGLLQWYVTGLYMAWNQRPFSYFQWLPGRSKRKLERLLFGRYRRASDKLADDRVLATRPLGEAIIAIGSRVGASAKWRASVSQREAIRFQQDLTKLVAKMRPDALVCFDKSAFLTFSFLQDNCVLRVLDQSTAHPAFHETLLSEERRLRPNFADTIILPSEKSPWYEQWCEEAKVADYVLAGSNFVKQTLVEQGVLAEKILVINYGIDPERFKPRKDDPPSNKFRLLFAGSIMQRKGIGYLLEAVSHLDLPDLELLLCGHFVGSGDGLKPYANYFRHLGYVPHRAMPEVYRQADVFVLPSLIEGLAQANLEAMASGLPVITTHNSGASDIIEDGVQGFLVPIRDPDALADRIEYLYRNRDKCKEMGDAAFRLARNFGWEQYNHKISQVFSQLLSSSDEVRYVA